MKVFAKSVLLTMFRNPGKQYLFNSRPFKNFGHKREPVPMVTTIWHGFLTFTFIGLVIEWEKIKKFLFGDSSEIAQEESIGFNDKI